MPVTNFTSFVGVQSGGTGDVDKLAASFDKLSASIDGTNANSKKLSEHPGFNDFASKVKSGLSDPMGTFGDAAESALKKLGPFGAGVVATGAIFTAFAKEGMDAARSLGSLADSIGDTSVRMGLTIKETGDFSFAMRRAGGDITSLEGVMKRLSQGLTDNSEEGAKARKGMVDLGITAYDGATNKLRPMSDVLVQLSEKLSAVEEPAKRNTLAISILGKGALAALPDLLELTDGLRRAKELGLSPSDNDIQRWDVYEKQIAEVDAQLEAITRKLKEPLAAVWSITFRGITGDTSDIAEAGAKALRSQIGKISPDEAQRRLDSSGGFFSASTTAEIQKLINDQIATTIGKGFSSGLTVDNSLFSGRLAGALGGTTDEGRLTEAKAKLKELQDTLRADTQLHKPISDSDLSAVEQQQRAVLAIEAQIKSTKDLEEAKKRVFALDKQSADMLAAASTRGGINNEFGAALAKIGINYQAALAQNPQSSLRGAIDTDFSKQFAAASITATEKAKASMEKFAELMDESGGIAAASMRRIGEMFGEAEKALDQNPGFHDVMTGVTRPTLPTGYTSPEEALRQARDSERRGVSLFGVSAQLAGQSEGQQIAGLAALRKKYADDEYAAAKRIADLKGDEVSKQDAIDQRHQKYLDAEIERQQSLLQLALQQKQSFQQTAVGFVNALESGTTSQFFSGLAHKFQDQIVSNIAGLGFSELSKAIPHAQSGTTLGKLLQGTPFGPDPLKEATMLNTLATDANTKALAALAISATGGGGGAVAGLGPRLGGIFSDLPLTHASGVNDLSLSPAFGADIFSAPRSSSLFSAKNIGSVAAGAGAAFGAYESFKAGGAKGALGGIGALTGGAALLDPEPVSKAILAGFSIASGLLVSLIPGLDPKAQRAKDLQNQAQSRAFTAPVGASYSGDTHGNSGSYDFQGGYRSITIINNVHAMDAPSLQDFLVRNPTAISAGITNAVQSGNAEDTLATLRSTL